jgi:hypothetical protein
MNEVFLGAVTVFNGLATTAGWLARPWAAMCVVIGVCLIWLAILEIEKLDRTASSKPDVERH